MQEEEAGEAAQEGGVCGGVGRNGRRGGVDAAAEKVQRSEAGAASLVHTAGETSGACLLGGVAAAANGKA